MVVSYSDNHTKLKTWLTHKTIQILGRDGRVIEVMSYMAQNFYGNKLLQFASNWLD